MHPVDFEKNEFYLRAAKKIVDSKYSEESLKKSQLFGVSGSTDLVCQSAIRKGADPESIIEMNGQIYYMKNRFGLGSSCVVAIESVRQTKGVRYSIATLRAVEAIAETAEGECEMVDIARNHYALPGITKESALVLCNQFKLKLVGEDVTSLEVD